MSTVTRVRRSPGAERSARWLTAALLATAVLILLVVPALAADPGAGAGFGVTATGQADQVDASGSPAPDASAPAPASGDPSPSANPSASASASPSASASASPSASPTAPPTPTPSPWPTPSYPTSVTTLGSTVKFYGKGYGHGVGMSQYGAKGRALDGQTAEKILAAYFKGSVPGTVSPARTVRVLVLAGYPATSSAPLVIKGRGGRWGLSTTDTLFPAGAVLTAWRKTATVDGTATTTWRIKVLATDGTTVLYQAVVKGKPVVRPVDAASYLQLDSKPSTYDTYRGSLKLVLYSSTVNVVNVLGLDAYLRGVVPMEMPSSWPRQALRAQAIACRSYAVKGLNPDTGTYDLYDDTRSQLYRGMEAEKAATDAVIAADPGAVIRYDGSVVRAFYFSTGGGATESNEYVFVGSSGKVGSPVAYLRAVKDRSVYGIPYDGGAPYYRWTSSTLTRDQLTAIFKGDSRTNVGDLQKLDLRKRGPGGRLRAVVLTGSGGSRMVSADVFRSVYNARKPASALPLRSNLFATYALP